MKGNDLIGALIVALFILVIMVSLIKLDGTETEIDLTQSETYWNGNGNEYIPIHYVTCTAIRGTNHVEVEWNGNLYSCLIEPESEIQTGDRITATFIIYEGNAELINIYKP